MVMASRTIGTLLVVIMTAVGAGACTVSGPPGEPSVPRAEVLGSGADRFGPNATVVLAHPEVRARAEAMYGVDWTAAPGQGRLHRPAADFFTASSAPRLVRIGETTYVAVPGCAANACRTDRGLLLISNDGSELLSRVDEGGFSHYYAFRSDGTVTPATRALLDGAWRALQPAASRGHALFETA